LIAAIESDAYIITWLGTEKNPESSSTQKLKAQKFLISFYDWF